MLLFALKSGTRKWEARDIQVLREKLSSAWKETHFLQNALKPKSVM